MGVKHVLLYAGRGPAAEASLLALAYALLFSWKVAFVYTWAATQRNPLGSDNFHSFYFSKVLDFSIWKCFSVSVWLHWCWCKPKITALEPLEWYGWKGEETPAQYTTLLNKFISTIGQFIFIFCDERWWQWEAWLVISYHVMQGDYSSEDKEQEIGFFSGADRRLVMNVWGNLV